MHKTAPVCIHDKHQDVSVRAASVTWTSKSGNQTGSTIKHLLDWRLSFLANNALSWGTSERKPSVTANLAEYCELQLEMRQLS